MRESGGASDQTLKLAVAISLLRSKAQQNRKDPNTLGPSQSDALRWKRKAKERKQELLRLREDLKDAQDASQCDLFPESASCKCYFFHNLGKLSPDRNGNNCDNRFKDVLRRRFLRQVRFEERRKRAGSSSQHRPCLGLTEDDETEQLRASVDFLVELCETISPLDESKFANLAHQAVDFILGPAKLFVGLLSRTSFYPRLFTFSGNFSLNERIASKFTTSGLTLFQLGSLKNLLSKGRNMELTEGVVNSLITRLVRHMSSPLQIDGSCHANTDAQFHIQHLMRKLGSEPYIGQRAILAISQRISVLAERFLFSDPFDDGFPDIHECMYIMIQLVEFLVSDYLLEWSKAEDFDNMLFEDWVTSILQARKGLELLESRNGLYVLYMDRVTGAIAKQVGQVSSLKLKPDMFNGLFL